jgi:hypothetical protein
MRAVIVREKDIASIRRAGEEAERGGKEQSEETICDL